MDTIGDMVHLTSHETGFSYHHIAVGYNHYFNIVVNGTNEVYVKLLINTHFDGVQQEFGCERIFRLKNNKDVEQLFLALHSLHSVEEIDKRAVPNEFSAYLKTIGDGIARIGDVCGLLTNMPAVMKGNTTLFMKYFDVHYVLRVPVYWKAIGDDLDRVSQNKVIFHSDNQKYFYYSQKYFYFDVGNNIYTDRFLLVDAGDDIKIHNADVVPVEIADEMTVPFDEFQPLKDSDFVSDVKALVNAGCTLLTKNVFPALNANGNPIIGNVVLQKGDDVFRMPIKKSGEDIFLEDGPAYGR